MSKQVCDCSCGAFSLCLIRSPLQPTNNIARARIANTRMADLPKSLQAECGPNNSRMTVMEFLPTS